MEMAESDEHPMRSTQASKDFMQSVFTDIGAVIMGRNLFDQTNGWNGGRSFFGAMEPGDNVTLGNPSRVAQGNRVTHLLYDVER